MGSRGVLRVNMLISYSLHLLVSIALQVQASCLHSLVETFEHDVVALAFSSTALHCYVLLCRVDAFHSSKVALHNTEVWTQNAETIAT